MDRNGHKSLDLTDLVEPATIKTGRYTFTLPLDISLAKIARIAAVGTKLQTQGIADSEYEAAEAELWRMADELLERAEPRPDVPAREFLTLPALFVLVNFLTEGFRSLQQSTTPSSSLTSTAAPSS